MAQTKATKKFEKKHLKDVIKRRKEHAKVKQRQQIKAKKKARKAQESGSTEDAEEQRQASTQDGKDFADMTVDEFFQGGFEIPDGLGKAKKSAKPKEVPTKTGKRKRDDPDEADSDASDSSSPAPGLGDTATDESDSEAEDAGDALDAHKKQLGALAEKDPEFYKFLQENDAELLDFAENADLAEIDDLSDGEDAETPRKKRKTDKKGTKGADSDSEAEHGNQVTKAMVKKWSNALEEQHSLRSLREVALAFRAAAHLNEDDGKEYKYSIASSEVYHELLLVALNGVPKVLQHHLPLKETKAGKIRLATESKKYQTLSTLLKSHAASVMHLLENLSDDKALRLVLSSLLSLVPYFLSFKKVVRDLGKKIVEVWSDASNTEAVRIAAFLVLRRLVAIGDPGIREDTLKATFQGIVKGSRNTTIHNVQGINLMKNSAAELWGLDPNVGYTTGFTFIRQWAIHLRSSITNNSNESYKTVYNWQYVHGLDFWSRVLSSQCNSLREAELGKESPLRPLIYPLTQVTLGALRLIPTPQYFPLRFQLIRSLLRLSLATGTYIPLAPALLEVLNSAEMKKPPKPSTLKSLDFPTSIRAASSYLRTRIYQDGLGEEVTELLSEFFVLWTKHIAFPELALPVVIMLKRWGKEVSNKHSGNKNTKINTMIHVLVQKLDANSRWIEERREKVDFAPDNRAGVEGFLKEVEWEKTPLGAYVVGQRKMREEKAKLVEEGRRQEEKKRQEERDAGREAVQPGLTDESESGEFEGIDTDEEDETSEDE